MMMKLSKACQRGAFQKAFTSQTTQFVQLAKYGAANTPRHMNVSEDVDDLLRKMNLGQTNTLQAGKHNKKMANEVEGEDVTVERPRIVQQKEDVIYIKSPSANWAFASILSLDDGQKTAMTLSLTKDRAVALLLNRAFNVTSQPTFKQLTSFPIELKFGHNQTCLGNLFTLPIDGQEVEVGQTTVVDLAKSLPKAPFRRQLVNSQLFSGHMRIDLGRPMTKGNLIFFKGERNTGKSRLAMNTVKHFLNEDPEKNRAIYVSASHKTGDELLSLLPEELKGSALAIGIQTREAISDAEYLLAPRLALQAAIQAYQVEGKNVLIVHDDVLLSQYKERQIYDLAQQPFAPVNMLNELMEHTGVFANTTVTSVIIADTQSTTDQFQRDENLIVAHIDSICDQIINFEVDNKKRQIKVPVLNINADQVLPHQKAWVSPFMFPFTEQFQTLATQLEKAYFQHAQKKQMKIDEDPWDNYLYYDSRYLLPILCHQQELPIEHQILIQSFVHFSLKQQTISQYTFKGQDLISELISFVEGEFATELQIDVDSDVDVEDEESLLQAPQSINKRKTLLERIKHASVAKETIPTAQMEYIQSELHRANKLFFLQMKVQGKVKEFSDDYFV